MSEHVPPTGERRVVTAVPPGGVERRVRVRLQPVLPVREVWTQVRISQPHPRPRLRPFPLDQPGVTMTYSGTAAIYQAFRALHLPAGSVVLCPSYNCGHELEPLVRLGLRVQCYRVGPDMRVDIEDIERRADGRVRAILVTHFFGFDQPLDQLRTLCDQRGILLIEDCAHALLSDNDAGTLGRVGDAAIYSMRKTVPLPNGGAVLFNNPAFAIREPAPAPPLLTTWLKAVDLAKKSAVDGYARRPSLGTMSSLSAMMAVAAGGMVTSRLWPSAASYDPDDDKYNFNPRILEWGISPFSVEMLDRIDWLTIADRRRHNYQMLASALEGLDGCEVLRPELPDWTCPLYLPVRVKRRAATFAYLVQRHIYPAVWWDQRHSAVDWAQFPEACDLKENVLALPIHQDVDGAQLAYLADIMRFCPVL